MTDDAAAPTKVDVKRSLDSYRASRGVFRVVDVPDRTYLMVDGHGDPNTSQAYSDALAALYPVAYTLKFASKRELGRDYVVPPLEGLWWADEMTAFTEARDKSQWSWTMMLLVPEWVDATVEGSEEFVRDAIEAVRTKSAPARLDDVRVETFAEGLCVQTLHIGPFDDEGPVLQRLHTEFIPSNDFEMTGKHHEIYLSDPRRSAPERLRTILRQPVRAV